MRRVADVMTPDPLTISADEVVGTARDLILSSGFHCLPVVDSTGDTVGVLSSWDLVEEYFPEESVTNAMTDRVERIGAHQSVEEAAAAMRDNFVHHLVVVGEEGELEGIVSSFDLLAEVGS